MTSEMRFGEKVKSGHAAWLRELVPHRLAYDAQCKSRDHLFADTTNCFDIAKQFSRTTFGVDQPLSAKIHMNDGEVSIRTDRLQGEVVARKARRSCHRKGNRR